MVVSVDEGYAIWLFGGWRDGGKVNTVDLSRRECAAKMIGHSASAAAHVKDTDRVFDWRMEDFAHHDLLNKFMLAVESLIFGCADVLLVVLGGYMIRGDDTWEIFGMNS